MESLYVENQIFVNATPLEVWEVLIDPECTKQYMFGCEVICEWKVGDPIIWKGATDGVTYVKGNLVEFEKPSIFAFTVFDPHADYPDIPQNYLTARYTLQAQDQGTLLKVTQGDYKKVAEGDKRHQDTIAQGGWGAVLDAIKKLLEKS